MFIQEHKSTLVWHKKKSLYSKCTTRCNPVKGEKKKKKERSPQK